MSSDLGSKPDSEVKIDMPKSEVLKDSDIKENINSQSLGTMPKSDLSEKIQLGKDVSKLPSIDVVQLTSILQGPNMPQKLMKEVTEKILMKNDECSSDDGSVGSSGGVVGMKGIMDCILEASFNHQDSEEESDVEGDEIFVRELPCKYCKKVFGSTMKLNTHVLMTHSQEDPSVLNVHKVSKRDKSHVVRCRKRPSTDMNTSEQGNKDRVRSRHNSKEQSLKVDGETCSVSTVLPQSLSQKVDPGSVSSSCLSSQKTIEGSSTQTTEDAKPVDLISSPHSTSKAPQTPELSSQQASIMEKNEDAPLSTTKMTTKRKSSNDARTSIPNSDVVSPKKLRRSRSNSSNQSGDSEKKDLSKVRRSTRRK